MSTTPPHHLRGARRALLLCLCLPAATFAAGGHGGLPAPIVELETEVVEVPFELPAAFPVPVVEAMIDGKGPFRLAVDTAMGGTVLLRRDVAKTMDLPVVGQAMVGDSSETDLRPADLIRIGELVVGGFTARNVLGLGFAADEAHLSKVPDDLDGILGNRMVAELLTTLDYPGRRLVLRRGGLDAGVPGTVGYVDQGGVMVVDLEIGGSIVPVIVDSGHRDTITLRRSVGADLPLAAGPLELDSLSTVSATYEREVSRLDGEAVLAGVPLRDPEIVLSEEDSPQLVGSGVLQHFVLTIDQRAGLLRFSPASEPPIEGIAVLR